MSLWGDAVDWAAEVLRLCLSWRCSLRKMVQSEHWATTGWTGLILLELKRFNQMLKLRSTDCLMAKSPTAVTVKFTAQIHAPHRIRKICWPINNYFLFKWPCYSNMALMNPPQRISLVTIIFSTPLLLLLQNIEALHKLKMDVYLIYCLLIK